MNEAGTFNSMASWPHKINIGCGFDIRPGFLNVDSGDWHSPDLVADVTRLEELPGSYFVEAVAQDVLEHIGRTQQVSTLLGWARLLVDNGILRVRVPSVVDMVDLLRSAPFKHDLERQHYWIQMLYGTQAYSGDFHLCGYTCLTLADLGAQAGLYLSEIELKDGWLFDATFTKCLSPDKLPDRGWLVYKYMTILQRVPDVDGAAYWLGELSSQRLTRRDVQQALSNSGVA